MNSNSPSRFLAVGVAAVALAAGAYAIGQSNASNDSAARAQAPGAQMPGAQLPQQSGQLPQQSGQPPQGFGTPATGAAAQKAAAAATAKYDGRVEQVMQLDDGSYVVHVITSSGEYHVHVSKDFSVTGADTGGPGGPPSSTGDATTSS